MSNQRSGMFFGGLLVGTAVGTVTSLLLAPKSGRENRDLMKKTVDALPDLAEDLSANLQLHAGRLSTSAIKRWDDTLERLGEAIEAGVDAAQAQRQQLHENAEQSHNG
ncbi:MAG: YtxH domain-containing protein [Thermosynechococcaceae cyanobacterium]